MKPEIRKKCKNYDCSEYEKESILLEDDKGTSFVSKFCNSCHHEGSLEISHKGIEATSINDFYSIVSGLAKEYHLLKRLADNGMSEADDEARFKEIHEQINELECTGCGQLFIEHEH